MTIVVDPMLATGNSSAAAIDLIKAAGATNIRFLCLLASPEGVARMAEAHPDVPIITAALDERLDGHGSSHQQRRRPIRQSSLQHSRFRWWSAF